jgi:hypothetical protein
MSEIWKTFLLEHGAIYDNGALRHFGNPQVERRAARDGDILVDLSPWSLLRVSGSDAKNFLNAQLTNELGLVEPTRSQLSAWCSPQGRMLALFRVFHRGDGYFLQLPSVLLEEITKRLRMFVLRAKVKIEAVDAELVRVGLVGANAESLLRSAAGAIPESVDAVVTQDAVTLLRLPGIHPRFEIVAPPAEAMALWEKLGAHVLATGPAAWSWHDIMAGVPTVLPATREAFVPQMANLELIGGVHFKKGCYPGQEIVARMQYLGRLKQRMVRAHVVGDVPPPGAPIFAPGANGQSVGTVVDAQVSPDGGADLLAVIQIAAVESGELRLGAEEGPPLSVLPLPYALATPPAQRVS